jgi:ATP-dependent Clp protease adaptor protein ClpS
MAERKGQGDVAVKADRKTARPKRFRVLLFNDDYTTMEFVVEVLESIFRKSPSEAVQVMLKVHKEGRGIAGLYPKDVAETKVLAVHEAARSAGFPLRAGMEEE